MPGTILAPPSYSFQFRCGCSWIRKNDPWFQCAPNWYIMPDRQGKAVPDGFPLITTDRSQTFSLMARQRYSTARSRGQSYGSIAMAWSFPASCIVPSTLRCLSSSCPRLGGLPGSGW